MLQQVDTKLSEKARWHKLIELLQRKLKGQDSYLIEESAQIRHNKEDKSQK